MRPADLFRRTSFRLALGVAVVILVTLILASAVGYTLMRQQLTARQDARVTEVFASLAQISRGGDAQDLIEAVVSRITASADRSTIFELRDASGAVLATNIPDLSVPQGWSTIEAAVFGIPTDYPYRVFSGPISDHSLLVGLTNADLDDLAEMVLGAFLWAAAFALIAALAAGALIAVRIQTRLTLAEETLAHVAKGDLTARLPLTGRGDDLDQLSGAINQTLTRLDGLVDAMRQVSTDVAHDLRTPLNRLRILIEQTAAKAANGLPVADDLDAALAESDTINDTFSALLRIAQIEGGARRAKFTGVDMAAVLLALAEVYAEVAEDAGMVLACSAQGAAWVEGDKELLTQMFANLIENAIRHCPTGTAITCAVKVSGTSVLATVSDTGPGIPAEARELVLRRLYRLEQSRTTLGSGLGLSLVKAVADLHEAELTLGDAGPGLRVMLTFAVRP